MPLRAASGRDGDDQGDGQPKGVGAGDHQHRDGPLHRLVGLAKGQPDDQGDEPGPEGEPEQPPGRPVGQGLGPRAGGLGLRDQPADPGHRRLLPHRVHPDPDRRVGDHRARHHPGAGLPGQRAGRRDLPGLVVVVRSLTKLWGLAGIRAGYLLAPPQTTSLLRAARQPWSINSLACAALAAWADQAAEHAAHRVRRLAAIRDQLPSAWLGCERDVVPCLRSCLRRESRSTTQVSRLAAAILVGQLKGNAFPQGVEMVHQLGQGAGGAHGRGVGTGAFEQAK
jgi:hypothetical protein